MIGNNMLKTEVAEILNQEEIDCIFPVADESSVRQHLAKFTASGFGFDAISDLSFDFSTTDAPCCGLAQCVGGPC